MPPWPGALAPWPRPAILGHPRPRFLLNSFGTATHNPPQRFSLEVRAPATRVTRSCGCLVAGRPSRSCTTIHRGSDRSARAASTGLGIRPARIATPQGFERIGLYEPLNHDFAAATYERPYIFGSPQDHDYLHRCVQRFRHAARSPGRKLFVTCCLVDSKASLESVRNASPPASATPTAPTDGPVCDRRLGAKASFSYFSPRELCRLRDGLVDFGVSDFKLVGIVLCTRSASAAMRVSETVRVLMDLSAPSLPGTDSEMFEVHLPTGAAEDIDPFKFFEDQTQNAVFAQAVLGRAEVCCEKDELVCDGYVPDGYRDTAETSSAQQSDSILLCRWCNSKFESRNRLFMHLRSSSECIQRISEVDSAGLASISQRSGKAQPYAFLLGSLSGTNRLSSVVQGWIEALTSLGALEVDVHDLGDFSCSAVGRVLLASFSCAFAGDALRKRLLARLQKMPLTMLHSIVQLKKSQLIDLQSSVVQRHFAYLLDVVALTSGSETCCNDLEELRPKLKRLKEAMQEIKVLRRETSGEGSAGDEEMKMVQRLCLHGKLYVVVRISGDASLSEYACCVHMAVALASFHGWHRHLSGDTFRDIPGLPSDFLYFEGYRFMQHEKRNGPAFGRSCLPWSSDNSCGIVEWRARLQEHLTKPSTVDWQQVLEELRTATLKLPDTEGKGAARWPTSVCRLLCVNCKPTVPLNMSGKRMASLPFVFPITLSL